MLFFILFVIVFLSLLPLEYSMYYFPVIFLFAVLKKVELKNVFLLAIPVFLVCIFLPQPIERLLYFVSVLLLPAIYIKTRSIQEIKNELSAIGINGEMFLLSMEYSKLMAKKIEKNSIAKKTRKGRFSSPLPIFHFLFRRAKALSLSIESRGYGSFL
ncbi:MAG: hypothetical protein QXY61_04900 [Candidatus Anstonellales archaeon]